MKKIPEIHQWTNGGERVLLVKCINRDGTSHNGFIWPKSGPVKPEKWSREPTCESGGLFGWPWGIGGNGRAPDACADWIVFAAKPENVIDLGGKAKAVPGEDGSLPEVVYRGSQAGAMYFTLAGRIAWIQARSSGSASATGYSGIASAVGEYSTLEVVKGIAVCTADRFYWKVRKHAVLLYRWQSPTDKESFPHKLLVANKLKLTDGDEVKIQFGQVVPEFTY